MFGPSWIVMDSDDPESKLKQRKFRENSLTTPATESTFPLLCVLKAFFLNCATKLLGSSSAHLKRFYSTFCSFRVSHVMLDTFPQVMLLESVLYFF